ncbi:MAG: hypothetical protein E7069_12145 [Bacteroidales bacterium]|jgi:hypothetical protein|nr:hypothetical protein [Bacteroidales bacterium]
MEIKTKFNIGDKVYYVGCKGPATGYVCRIRFSSSGVDDEESYDLEFNDDYCACSSLRKMPFYECELFATKEELLEAFKKRLMGVE